MFTGIVEETGTVHRLEERPNLAVLSVEAGKVFVDAQLGSSIAIDGVCLTVTGRDGSCLTFDVMWETLRATTLGELKAGDRVNLERAVRADGRLDGHIVTGHVDRIETLKERVTRENYLELRFTLDNSIARYLAPKGSVTVNGVSLTVGEVSADGFSVYIIPATEKHTNLGTLPEGHPVNIEVDILARYIERQMAK
ncbi:MAG: riboflavin synthase [Candidatus Omnitrophica bacterium]|nr:riboflavin synthase [Candidatus Omnitrophota bacterium]MCB9720818.1 riboflavin synthase [Candidatus Omnitrophota bacterium]